MNILNTTQKSGTLPLERKSSPAQRPVYNSVETPEEDRKIGWFDEKPVQPVQPVQPVERVFDATGSINFSLDTVVPSSTVSNMFLRSNEWVSITPSNVADKVVGAASTVIKAAGDLAPDIKDAGLDLFNQMAGKTEIPQVFQQAFEGENPSKLDPTIETEQQKKQDLIAATRNSNTIIENAIKQVPQQEYEDMIKVALRLGVNVETLADKLNAPHLRKAELLKIYYIALGCSVQEADQKVAARTKNDNAISSPSRHGAEGPGMSLDDNKSSETHSTAQTATG